jgi:hypothetical protein
VKQVRYLAGVAGLAPLAIGLAAPPAAGSVQASTNCKSARVAISNGTKALWSRAHTNICGTPGAEKHTSFSVHQYFTGQIWLWVISKYGDQGFVSFA